MKKDYKAKVNRILKEIERVLIEDVSRSHGTKIVIEMGVGELTSISYEVKGLVVDLYGEPIK